MARLVLDPPLASRFARVALENVAREYPNKLEHLMQDAADARRPSDLHPVFFGSYDWHSSVHMHWTMATLLARFPALPEGGAIAEWFDAHLTPSAVAVECAYFARPGAQSFERPYGWAWLLALSTALGAASNDPRFAAWNRDLQPLADIVVARFVDYLPRADYPSRAGTHGNSAFALLLALDHADGAGIAMLGDAVRAKAQHWFVADRDYPVAYETSSEDFIPSGLVEAVLMRRVFGVPGNARFFTWWGSFVPDRASLSHWLRPVRVTDRTDPRLAHLDGLNLARAWCWSLLIDEMPDAFRPDIEAAIDAHLAESLPHAAEGAYVGTHWLASFALLALT